MQPIPLALLSLNPYEARTAAALFDRLFPADENSPGATEMGVLSFLDRALAGAYRDHAESYRVGLATLDQIARQRCARPFADCSPEQQDTLLSEMEQGTLPTFRVPPPREFFNLLRAHLQEGLSPTPLMTATGIRSAGAFWATPGSGSRTVPKKTWRPNR